VAEDDSSLEVDLVIPSQLAWSEGWQTCGNVLHSSSELTELSQWPCHAKMHHEQSCNHYCFHKRTTSKSCEQLHCLGKLWHLIITWARTRNFQSSVVEMTWPSALVIVAVALRIFCKSEPLTYRLAEMWIFTETKHQMTSVHCV